MRVIGVRAERLMEDLFLLSDVPLVLLLEELDHFAVSVAERNRLAGIDVDDHRRVLEARHPSGETHAIGVLIENLGVMAKDILLADSIDRVAEMMRKHPRDDGELTLERIAAGIAAGRIDAAIELTEMTLDPPVADDYARLRALAMLRADEVSDVVAMPERDELPHEERDRLRDEFLASAGGKGVRLRQR
jgi:hypothetical protein